MPPSSTPPAQRLLERLINVREGEVRIILWSCAYFFFMLAGYYALRSVREALGLTAGVENLPWLYLATFGSMLAINPIFAALVSRYSRRVFVPVVYIFLGVNIAVFFVLFRALPESGTVGPARAFYIWLSVIGLFINSLFWSTMADVFRPEQSKRLFGLIGVGGTTGAIVGSATAVLVAKVVGKLNQQAGETSVVRVEDVLLPVAFGLFVIACLCAMRVDSVGSAIRPRRESGEEHAVGMGSDPAIGGHMWAGITNVFRSPYLLGICLFLLFYTLSSTITYFIQAHVVDRAGDSREEHTELFGQIDLWVNVLTLITQLFLTGRIIRRIGVGFTLGLLPVVSLIGFAALSWNPVLMVLVVFQVVRRGTNYALTKPARESLFTVIPREDKYKAKNFIDTFFYRGGDVVGAAGFAVLTGPAIGLGLAGVATLAIPLMVVWFIVGLLLGLAQAKMAARPRAQSGDSPPPPESADSATLSGR